MKRMLLTFCTIAIVAVLATTALLSMNQGQGNVKTVSPSSAEMAGLQTQYDSLKELYDNLQGNYTAMQNAYNELQAESRGDAYDTLKAQYNQYMANYAELREEINLRAFAESGQPLITPSDPQVISLVRNITGKANVTDSTQNWDDIKAMYDWVKNNVKYAADGWYPVLAGLPAEGFVMQDQMVQFSNETINLKKGDCDDIAVLLVSMIRAYNPKFTAEGIWITSNASGHIAVQIPVYGNKVVILDPLASYYSHDALGGLAFNDVTGEIANWMNVWRSSMGNDAYVYRVFSDYVDKTFATTNDYLTWMYSR